MRHSLDTKKYHRDNDAGSGSNNQMPAPSSTSSNHTLPTSAPHLVPSFRSRSRRLLHQRVHYSSGPIILLWDEIDENVPSTDDSNVYENDLSNHDEDGNP